MKKKTANAVLGFVISVVMTPVAVLFLPFFAAWWLYNETDDDF